MTDPLPRAPRRRDHWELRPRDLPSAKVLAREPRLRELENNAVFRAMLAAMHGEPWWRRLSPIPRAVAVIALMMFAFYFLRALWPLMVVVLILMARRSRTPAGLLTLPEPLLDDLLNIPLPVRDWSLAHWGFSLTPYGRSVKGWVMLFFLLSSLGLMLASMFAMTGAEDRPIVTTLAFAVATILTLAGGSILLPPHGRLPMLVGRLRSIRREIYRKYSFSNRLADVFVAVFVAVMLLMVFTLGVILVTMLAAAVFGAMGPELWERIVAALAHRAAPGVAVVLGVLLGAASVGLWGLYAGSIIEGRLDALDREFVRIFKLLRRRRDPEAGLPS